LNNGTANYDGIAKARAFAALVVLAAACGGGAPPEDESNGRNVESTVMVSPENVVTVDSMEIATGPMISGSLQPDRIANIRAEIGGSVLATQAEPGQRVARGALLVRIDDTAIRDAFLSAQSAVTSAEQSEQLARRNLERSERLAEAGAIAERALEDARVAASTAAAQLADAKARFAQAQKQLAATTVRSPINGVVSERAVGAGDVVSPGTQLYTVVDPASMRLEASVPASQLGLIRVGAPVEFRVTGYTGRLFEGTVDRINPTADPQTGQIVISATVPNEGGQLVGGVFAEGRVGTQVKTTLAAPVTAIQRTGQVASALRIRGGIVERVDVQLGIRDDQAEMFEITAGLEPGDTLLTGSAQGVTPGTPVRIQADRAAGN
jgi:RND family efflux transporter MFP subunit